MKKYILAVIVLVQFVALQSVKADTNTSLGCTVSISASPTTIQSGHASMLTWTSQGCATVWVNNYDVNLFPSGYLSTSLNGSVSPGDFQTNSTFTVVGSATADSTYENANGTDAQATATITVTPATTSGCNVIASGYPLNVASGQSSTLTWSTVGCATVWVVNQNGTVVSTANSGSISTGAITGDTPFMVHGELT